MCAGARVCVGARVCAGARVCVGAHVCVGARVSVHAPLTARLAGLRGRAHVRAAGVGKTSLVMRYVHGTYAGDVKSTVGAAFLTKRLCVLRDPSQRPVRLALPLTPRHPLAGVAYAGRPWGTASSTMSASSCRFGIQPAKNGADPQATTRCTRARQC